MRLDPSFGKLLWIVNTTLVLTIFFVVEIEIAHPFEKALCGLLGQLKWGLDGI
jgi:hypothetical protein